MMSRPAKYRNAADRQKAYRERKKTQPVIDNPYAELIAEVEQQIDTLRTIVTKYSVKGRAVEILVHHNMRYAQVRDYHSLFAIPNPLVVSHMISTGELIEVRRDWAGKVYQLKTGGE